MRAVSICPFCSKQITFSDEDDVPHALHGMPFCKQFAEAEDALAFIVAVNNENARREGRGRA